MALIAIVSFASCQKSEEISNTNSQESTPDVPGVVQVGLSTDEHGEPVLSFKTKADMNTQFNNLTIMSETESEQWYSGFDGYVSQNQFMWSVVDELDKLRSLEEIKVINDKYAGLLIFNDNEADMDISPYVPSTYYGKDLLCNKYGNVMINGEIHNYNNVTSYSEFESPITTKWLALDESQQEGVTQYVQSTNSRLWVSIHYFGQPWDPSSVFVRLESKRESWVGFINHKTNYALRYEYAYNWGDVGSRTNGEWHDIGTHSSGSDYGLFYGSSSTAETIPYFKLWVKSSRLELRYAMYFNDWVNPFS